MTTIINTPTPPAESSDSGASIIIGVILALILVTLFFMYILPAINNRDVTTPNQDGNININVKIPTVSTTP